MTNYAIDTSDWLITATRRIGEWVTDALVANSVIGSADDIAVEMSFPDTRSWVKEVPLSKILIHFEMDDQTNPVLGFGTPGSSSYDEDAETATVTEVAMHLLNYDVGIWVSAEMGGSTKRMQVRQALTNLFTTATARRAFKEELGIQIVSFNGGGDVTDRINDIPVWRTTAMTLIVRVFSTHVQPPLLAVEGLDQGQKLTITGPDGGKEEVRTIEDAW